MVRERFTLEVQQGLLDLAWWNWPQEKLKESLDDFRQLDAARFVEKYT